MAEQAALDIRQGPISKSIIGWLLAVALVFFACHGRFSFFSSTDNNLTGLAASTVGEAGRQFGLIEYVILPGLAYSIVMWLVISNISLILSVAFQMKTMTLLSVFTVFSAIWSQDPTRTTYNGLFYLVGTFFAYYLVSVFSNENVRTLMMMTGVLVCVIGVVIVIAFPQYGLSNYELRTAGAWRGIFMDRTTAGKCLTFLLSPALVFGYRTLTAGRLAYIAILFGSLVMAQSATALIVTMLYMLFMISLTVARRLERRTALVLGITALATIAVCIGATVPFFEELVSFFGRDLTLTGRTEIWAVLMPSIFQRPILGYGFYAFWLGLTGESGNVIHAARWFFGYAHNGLLEIVLQLGLCGLILFSITFAQAVKDALICYRERSIGIQWYIGILLLTVLYNVDESTVLWPTELLSILYIVACTGLSMYARRIKAANELQ